MNTGAYEIGFSIPVEGRHGKLQEGKENTKARDKDPKTRNELYGFVAIKAMDNSIKKEELGDEAR